MNCVNCGAPLKDGAKFCISCGAPQASASQASAVCSGCSAHLKPGAKFCIACGTPTGAAPAPAPQAPAADYDYSLEATIVEPRISQPRIMPESAPAPAPAPAPEAAAPVYSAPQAPAYVPPVYQPNAYAAAPAAYGTAPSAAPVNQLSTSRGLAKFIILTIVTFGIYSIVAMCGISRDINIIASRYDGRKTMNYILVFLIFSWLTFGIVPLVWYTKLSGRIGNELRRRGINYGFGAGTFWLWNVLGMVFAAGPFIYMFKLFRAMNKLSADYNVRG